MLARALCDVQNIDEIHLIYNLFIIFINHYECVLASLEKQRLNYKIYIFYQSNLSTMVLQPISVNSILIGAKISQSQQIFMFSFSSILT